MPAGVEPFSLAVKANIAVAGFPFSGSNRALARRTASADAAIVALLRHRGAVVVGTTSMHELAFGITSNNAAYGPVRNPHDPERTAGGSSGGSAAAVASGEVDLALGSDTGGSIAIPASLSGTYGYRPSVGLWPLDGKIGLSWTRDTIGVFARDLDRILDSARWIAGTRPADIERPVIGVPAELVRELHPSTRAAWDAALDRLREAVEIVELEWGEGHDLAHAAEMPVVLFETRQQLAAHAAEAFDCPPSEALARLRDKIASPDVRAIVGSMIDAPVPADEYAAQLANVHRARDLYERMLDDRGLDVVAFPSTPAPAPPIGDDATVEHLGERVPTFPLYIRNTGPGTMLGAPMATLPLRPEGLPVGLTLMGRRFGDAATLGAARTVDGVFGGG
ncbi:MAG: hypothetical protein GXX90_05680 [Microbacteriaceae bacterium]|nr:hypothetical protein [Microbacteriaceae bacterium]